jgi:hypothetical protein
MAGVQLRPGVAGGDVDRGVLPDRALRPRQATDEKAVDADLLSGPVGIDVPGWWWRRGRALVGVAVPGDQGQALGAGVEPKADEDAPNAVLTDPQAAPFLSGEFGADASGSEAGVRQGEGDDPLFDVRPDLVGYPRAPALTNVERLKAPAVDLALEAVIRRPVHTHQPARLADVPEFLGQREQS